MRMCAWVRASAWVRAWVRASVSARARVRAWVRKRAWVRARVRACVRLSDGWAALPQVSANTDEENILRGFRAGSNDYVKKPFSRAEVLAR